MFNWLTIEITNRCNKACWFCGRAKIRDKMYLGDMDIGLFKEIIKQYKGEVIQFSRDGEPLLYDKLAQIGGLCQFFTTNIVTNGILLWEKHLDIYYGGFSTITVSVIENDSEQFKNIKTFLEWNVIDKPIIFIKFLGNFYDPSYEKLGLKTMKRIIHHPSGDWEYKGKKEQLIPEIGVCQDFLFKPSINWEGEFFICNRFDPEKKGKIGDCRKQSLEEIWDSEIRLQWLEFHKKGRRDLIPLCKKCEFWGVPRYQ